MSEPTPPPYPFQPGPPPYPPPYPPPSQPPRRSRPWRAAVAGGVAGGLLGAAVAVPITWQLAGGATASDRDGSAEGAAGDGDPGISAEPFSPIPEQAIPDFRAPGRTTGTAASEDQSRGVLLVGTELPNGSGAGTALVLDSSGLALTNYHVVDGSTTVRVTVASTGESYDADVLGYDDAADVALLQVRGADDLEAVDLDDDGLDLKDEVTAVGNALGRGELLASSGEVTGLDEGITAQEGIGAQALSGMIETSAAVVSGYSGGPLYDEEGEVVGITTATSTGVAQSYAVPIETALDVADQIEAGDESDGVHVGPSAYLGISISDTASGVRVESVEEDGAAAAAGVEAGATITGLDGARVREYADLAGALEQHDPGDRVELAWTDAEGERHTAEVTLGESPLN